MSQLEVFYGKIPVATRIPHWMQQTTRKNQRIPISMLDKLAVKFHNKVQDQYLIEWEGLSDHDTSWEVVETFELRMKYAYLLIQ